MAQDNSKNDLSANIRALEEDEQNELDSTDNSVDTNPPTTAFDNTNASGEKFIAASDQMRDFLNMDNKDNEANQELAASNETIDKFGQLPPDLPFMEGLETPVQDPVEKFQPAPQAAPSSAGPLDQILGPAGQKGGEAYAFLLWALKSALPYIVIFIIGLGLYFFYFSDFSINSLFKSNKLTIENVEVNNKDLEKLKKDQAGAYSAWMKQFFFEVNDEAIISMDADVSGNGLTNFEKYLLNLNPKVFSTRGNSMSDGSLVLENTNPWTGKPFTDQQKELVDKYINKELISNRITAAALSRGVTKFAQYVSPDSPYYIDPSSLNQVAQNNEALNLEIGRNQTTAQVAQQVNNSSSSNGSSSSNIGASSSGGSSNSLNLSSSSQINSNTTGKLEIPANKISVPITWTKDVKDFDADLKKGLVHYPGTVMPGEIGTSYISGHSSGYLWDSSPYKQVFATLGQVKDGTSFSITTTDNSGKKIIYHYVVKGRGEYAADDQAQFVNTADSVVALSTCWPVGTTARRLVLFGKLTQTERQ